MPHQGPSSGKSSAKLARWARRIVIAVVVAGVVALLVFSLMPRPLAVEVARVDRGVLEVTIDEEGRAQVIDRYTVTAPVAGDLSRIDLRASDAVTIDRAVALVMPTAAPLLDPRARASAEAAVATARAQREAARFAITRARDSLGFAEREATRQRRLAERGVLAGRDLEVAELDEQTRRNEVTSAELALRVAEHEVLAAEASLSRLSGQRASRDAVPVTPPVDGVVLRVLEESAGPVQPGTALIEIGDPSALEIVAEILTSDAVGIPASAEVRIDRWGGDGELAARVRLVEPSAFTRVSALGVEEQRVNVIIDLASPRERWASLGDGFRVEVHVVVWRGEDILRAPASAVFRREDRWSTFVVEDGVAHLRHVEIGHRARDHVEIVAGISEGATVIVYPGERITEGVAVTPH